MNKEKRTCAMARNDERDKVLDELVFRIDTIPVMLIGSGVIFSPTIKYVKGIIEELRGDKI